jgi:hypothetical protein
MIVGIVMRKGGSKGVIFYRISLLMTASRKNAILILKLILDLKVKNVNMESTIPF